MGPEVKFLIPREGLIVRDPRSKEALPKEGKVKPWIGPEGRYWRRRVKCGDCHIGKPPASTEKKNFVEKKSKNFKMEDDK